MVIGAKFVLVYALLDGVIVEGLKDGHSNSTIASFSTKKAEEPDDADMNFTLLDEKLFKPIIISLLPKEYKSTVGAEAKFVCLTTVFFPVEVDWYLNGQRIEPSTDGRVYFNNNKRELVILSLRSEDQGNLVVMARNKFGVDTSSSLLKLQHLYEGRPKHNRHYALENKILQNKNQTFYCRWRQDLLKDNILYL